jgi:hypothetical protein
MLTSSQVVNAYAASVPGAGRARWDYERRPRCATRAASTSQGGGRPEPAHRRGPRPGQRHPHQRRPALRRPRAPGVLHPEVTNPRDAVVWDKAGERVMARGRRARPPRDAGRAAGQPLQEQHRQQGRVLRHPRELPHAPHDAVRRHRPAPHPVLRLPPGRDRSRAGRHRQDGREHGFQISQRADFFEVEVGSRPRSSGRSSTPATSRTPTREVPPAARHHRRREPRGGLDLPQARHDVARAGHDRGRRSRPRPRLDAPVAEMHAVSPRPGAVRTW